jgi:uncharacterized protein YecE (DUF72 family)
VAAANTVAHGQPAAGAVIGGCRALAGASSWADRSLVRESTFYPSRTLSAAQRLAHYATRLPLAEVATTYRFPPTPEVSRKWVSSTPPGFKMDLRAWSLLCGAPTWPESLWPDLQGHVRPTRRDSSKLYRHHLPAEVVDECWQRFHHAVRPLAEAGRLGAVVVRFPSWFAPRQTAREELAALPARLAGYTVAVELTNDRWFQGGTCEQTLGLLERLGLCFVCRDRPGPTGPVVAATADLALVRFPGRAPSPRPAPTLPATAQGPDHGPAAFGPATWWYRYSRDELAAWVPAVRDLASCTSEVHLIMDNCWRAHAVDNAATLLELLAERHDQPAGPGSA